MEKRTNSSIGFKNKHYSTSTGQETIEMSPISPTPRRAPGGNSLIPPDAHTSPDALHPPGRASFGFWDPHYLDRDGLHTPSGSIDSIAYFGDERGEASTPLSFNSKTALAGLGSIPAPSPSPAPGVGAIARNATTYTPQVPVPPGFAHATLLPGRTVRLRILPRGAFSWAPGQHVLVGVPAVSRLSTHPFSIASVCDELTVAPEAAAHAAEKGANNEVLVSHNGLELVILIRAKKGWTRRLWNLIDAMQGRGERILPSERSQLPSGYTLPAVDRSASGGGFNAMGGVPAPHSHRWAVWIDGSDPVGRLFERTHRCGRLGRQLRRLHLGILLLVHVRSRWALPRDKDQRKSVGERRMEDGESAVHLARPRIL